MLSNRKLNSIVTEFLLFLSGNHILKYQKDVTLNTTQFFYHENSKQTRTSTNCI